MHLVQPYRGTGSGNSSKEVSINKDVRKSILDLIHYYLHNFSCFRLRDHVQGADNNPLLIFPEGTCVNNHYTVMFKKVCELFAIASIKCCYVLLSYLWNRFLYSFLPFLASG